MTAARESATLAEAKRYAERGLSSLSVLHLGPLDYNCTEAADDLLTAARLVKEYQREQER